MKILNLFAVLLLALIPTRVAAQTMDVQPTRIEWSDSTRLALAQCLLGEAGWRRRTEHSAISHVLLRRWHRLGSGSFEGRVRRYCSVHRTTQPTDRHQWVRNMPWGPLLEDPGLPASVNWRNYIDDWDYVRTTVELFEKSALVDPLPHARHWGGAMDGIPVGGVLLARSVGNVAMRNLFYAVDDALVQRIRAARRRPPSTGIIRASLARGTQS